MPPPVERSVCSARVQPSTTGSTASRWLGFGASVIVTSPDSVARVPGRGEVVLDVAGASLVVRDHGVDRPLAFELAQNRLVGEADRVHEHVQAAAMRHADHDLVRSGAGGDLDRLVEHRHHRVQALDRELLLAEERAAEVLLEPLDAGERLQQADALFRLQRLPVAARLDRLPEPDPLGVIRQVLDLVGHRAGVDLAQRRERFLQRLAGDVHAQQLRRDPRLQLRRQRRDQARLVERGIAERLGAERVEARRQVAVHPVRLDESHRGGDAAEQRLVDRGRRCGCRALGLRSGLGGRCSRRRRWRRRGRGVPVAALERLQQPQQARVRRDELAVAALEELAPLGGDRVGVLEVVLEQEPGVAGVQAVDVVRTHRLCCSNRDEPRTGDCLVEGVLRDDRDRHPHRPADHADRDRDARQPLLPLGHPGGDQGDDDRERDDPDRAVDHAEAAGEDGERREQSRDRVRRRPAAGPGVP